MEQEIGALLIEARTLRRCSLANLAERSGVHRSTLSRWEAQTFEPRLPELRAVLDALEIAPVDQEAFFSLLKAPRGVRHLKGGESWLLQVEEALFPSGGDLFRAMRHRSGLNLNDASRTLNVHVSTLSRWERSDLMPGEEDRERLFTLYHARPEEREILGRRSLLLAKEPMALATREELHQRLQLLTGLSWSGAHPLLDLNYLSLEAACWSLMQRDEWARFFLTTVYAWHGIGLYWQHRFGEAREMGLRALALSADLPPDNSWLWAAGYTARASISLNEGSAARREIRLLSGYAPMAQHLGVVQLIDEPQFDCVMASGSGEDALQIAKHIGANISKRKTDYWTQRAQNWRMTKAYIKAEQWDAALALMPTDEQPNFHQKIEEKLTWVELLLATGELTRAGMCLLEARALMHESGIGFTLADRLERQL